MKAGILTIGTEILQGLIVNTNATWIARKLDESGFAVQYVVSVPDDVDSIMEAVRQMKSVELIVITGGLGPTEDDMTKEALSKLMGVKLSVSDSYIAHIEAISQKFGFRLSDWHYRQCQVPENAELIGNDFGSALGMWFEFKGQTLISVPGVPFEMKHMITSLLPRLSERVKTIILHRTLHTVGLGESRVAERIESFEKDLPRDIRLSYLPDIRQVLVRLTIKGRKDDKLKLTEKLTHYSKLLEAKLSDVIYGYDDMKLEAAVGEMLRSLRLQVGTAESCTGGYLAHMITSVPGASDYFCGSILAYTNDLKVKLLHVPQDILDNHGAVSEQCVRAMVHGGIEMLNSDIVISTSGIAGPGGGTADKPVGTIWIACGDRKKVVTRELHLADHRDLNIRHTSVAALNLLRKFLNA